MTRSSALIALALLGVACASNEESRHPTLSTAMGWRFGPGFSCKDPKLFEQCPQVLKRDGAWYLTWIYGSDTFYYSPSYEARDGQLVFALQATASSGRPSGRRGELAIDDADAVRALERSGAVWWEPDGSYVPLARASR